MVKVWIDSKVNYEEIFSAESQAPVVQKVDSAIHWLNLYPLDNAIGFPNSYSLDRDLSSR